MCKHKFNMTGMLVKSLLACAWCHSCWCWGMELPKQYPLALSCCVGVEHPCSPCCHMYFTGPRMVCHVCPCGPMSWAPQVQSSPEKDAAWHSSPCRYLSPRAKCLQPCDPAQHHCGDNLEKQICCGTEPGSDAHRLLTGRRAASASWSVREFPSGFSPV